MRGARSLAVLLGAAIGAASASRPAGDPDVYWHLATAREALANGIVRTDLFSWTIRGAPVSTDQWLGQLLLYGAYLVDGWAGLVLLRGVAVAALVALVFANAAISARGARLIAPVVATVPAIFVSRYVWTERPELFGFVCFAALLLLLRMGRSGSDRALALVVPLLLVWANLHGSFALGVALVAGVSLEGAWREPARRRSYAIVALASLAATLLTPAGLGAWTAPGYHFLTPPREIQEWAVPDIQTGIGALFGVAVVLVVAIALITRSLPAREAVILLPVAILASTAVRHTPLFAIAAAPYLAAFGPAALGALRARALTRPRPSDRVESTARAFRMFSLGAAMLFGIVAIVIAPAEPDESGFPVAALSVIPVGPGLFNHYDWGGWLIWHASATPVFIDGRYTPYRCCGVLDDYRTVIAADPGWSEVVGRRDVRSILVRPRDPIAIRGIESGWTVLARAPGFVLLRIP
jgi:hypothetical protein